MPEFNVRYELSLPDRQRPMVLHFIGQIPIVVTVSLQNNLLYHIALYNKLHAITKKHSAK